MLIPTLHTDRLTLRAPKQSDYEPYVAFRLSDRAASVGGPYTRPQAFNQFCELIGHWTIRGFGRWIIADRTTDEAYGTTGIYHPEDWPQPELAWSLFENGEGKGIAFEAARAARTYAFETLGLTRLISLIDPANTRSIALARRLGCTPGGTFDHAELGTLHYWLHPAPGKDTA